MLIYPAVHDQLDHLKALRRHFPVVLLIGGPDVGIDVVSVDDRSGAHRAVKHLIDLGHRRIGLLNPQAQTSNSEKYEGYQRALAEAGIAFDPELVVATNGHYATHGYYALDNLMSIKNPPTAVFSHNDSLAFGALRWCHRNGTPRAAGPRDHGLRQHRVHRVRRAADLDHELCRRRGVAHGGRPPDAPHHRREPSHPNRASR